MKELIIGILVGMLVQQLRIIGQYREWRSQLMSLQSKLLAEVFRRHDNSFIKYVQGGQR